MLTLTRKILLATGIAVAFILGTAAFCAMQIECPYCHNSDANVKGNCVLRQRTGYCREDYYDEHNNKSSCRWCWGRGRMSRWEALWD